MVDNRRVSVATTRCLFTALSVAWAVAGLNMLTRTVSVGSIAPSVAKAMAALMLGNAAVLGILAWRSLRGQALVDYAAVVVVLMSVAAIFADQIGAVDIAYLAVGLALLGSLLWNIRVMRVAQSDGFVH